MRRRQRLKGRRDGSEREEMESDSGGSGLKNERGG